MAEDDNQSELMDQFLEKITPKLTESVLGSVTSAVEEQIKGVLAKNDDLISRLKHEKLMSDNNALLKSLDGGAPKKEDDAPEAVQITKADARDVSKYRAARAKAEKAGVQLQITTE